MELKISSITTLLRPLLLLGFLSCGVHGWFPASNVLLSGSKAYLTYADSVAAGLSRGMQECRSVFYWDRWNCPDSSLSTLYKHKPSREMSFVHAITAAGVMYVLTKNCSEGAFIKCGCDDSKKGEIDDEGWTWGGCSDNVKFGERISKQFVDAIEVGRDALSMTNLHNNEAGRKAVRNTLEKRCKCHGVSGSCTLQTCWTQLSDFKTIGRYLRKKYHAATKVDLSSGHLIENNDIIDAEGDLMLPSKRDLVYLEDSPEYCYVNDTYGFHGTVDRECLKRTNDAILPEGEDSGFYKDSCNRLCKSCGLTVRKTRVVESSNCNCKFMWCCSVKCDQCKRKVTKYTCQPRQ